MANELPGGNGLTDLNLIKHVDADVLGSPETLQQLQDQLAGLQATLGEAPPTPNNYIDAAVRGAIEGSQGVMVNPLTGEETAAPPSPSFGRSLLVGLQAGLEGSQANALTKYEARQKQAQAAAEQRDKLSAGIRMVLAQNPLALEQLGSNETGKRIIGMLAYGIDIPIDPTAKSRDADETLQKKQLMRFYLQAFDEAATPSAKALAFNSVRDIVDPDGELKLTPEDFRAKKPLSAADSARLYGDAGLAALNTYQLTGDYEGYINTISNLNMVNTDKRPASQRVKDELAGKIGFIMRDYTRANPGKELTIAEAIKQLGEEDQVRAATYLKNIDGDSADDVPFSVYVRTFGAAYDDVPLEVRESDPASAEKMARDIAAHRITAARAAKKADNRANRPTPADSAVAAPGKVPDAKSWRAKVIARATKDGINMQAANKILVSEAVAAGKVGEVPMTNRKAAGY